MVEKEKASFVNLFGLNSRGFLVQSHYGLGGAVATHKEILLAILSVFIWAIE